METVTIDGIEYERVYVSELESGMVNPFGETVDYVERLADEKVRIHWTNDEVSMYWRALSTILIDTRTIRD